MDYHNRNKHIRNFSDNFHVQLTDDSQDTELSKEDRWDIYSEDSQKETKLARRLEKRKLLKKKVRDDFKQKYSRDSSPGSGSSSPERRDMAKKILEGDYNQFFDNSFKLRSISNELKHLAPDEKVIMLDNVIGALDVDLKKYSSQNRI